MGSNDQGRVSIDPKVIKQDRELQIRNKAMTNNMSTTSKLNIRGADISKYDYNGNGLSVQPGTYIKENTEADGTPL